MMDFKTQLNDKQYEAVTTSAPFVRIIAGAGSGKTRVLTYRIAFLINEMRANPYHILAITFTNKVAKEMRERVEKLLDDPELYRGLSIMTFHSFCARFLRHEIHNIGYSSNFTIIDDDDQEKIVKDLAVAAFDCSKKDDIIKASLKYIQSNKSRGILPIDIDSKHPRFPDELKCLTIYTEYEKYLEKTSNLDFDDLLLKTIRILKAFPIIKRRWQDKIDHILIDEFQDTNDVQYQLVKLFKKETTTLYVVGDPDQTIYTWRGANQNIILNLNQDYPIETIILNENYRSTQTILNTANKLISHNKMRVKKDLFTHNTDGDDIAIASFYRSDEEANWVVDRIEEIKRKCHQDKKPFSYRQIVLLYRSSYLTLPFEKAFNRMQMPYHIFGGLRFYQRKEIKDVLAYFQLLINKDNDVAFLRIINVPRRAVGDKALQIIRNEAANSKQSLYDFINTVDEHDVNIRSSVLQSLKAMVRKLENTKEKLESKVEAYSAILQELIINLGYQDYLLLNEDDGDERWENVKSLFDDISNYIQNNPESGFNEYMENVSLQSAQDDITDGDYISMMTIHTAKGLEFPYVFVIGLSEGVFPSVRTLEENPILGLEEERRLCYVAFTRAMSKLFISCNREYSYVLGGNKPPSRFFKEAGLKFYTDTPSNDYMKSSNKKGPYASSQDMVHRASSTITNGVESWAVGDVVEHEKFGLGVVSNIINSTIIMVHFTSCGSKTLMSNHPALKKIDRGGFDA